MGRWSERIAAEFVRWLGVPAHSQWLDVGCGTGALTATILAMADPTGVVGVDPSEGFLTTARARIGDARGTFRTGDAQSLPVLDRQFDAVVSGLVLNFVPDPHGALAEFVRVARPGEWSPHTSGTTRRAWRCSGTSGMPQLSSTRPRPTRAAGLRCAGRSRSVSYGRRPVWSTCRSSTWMRQRGSPTLRTSGVRS